MLSGKERSSMCRRLENKTAVVTGADFGIGKAIANRFASEGSKVMVADVAEVAQEIVDSGENACSFRRTCV